ncbi:hypothetical protein QQP08_009397 [Theobroma cacao]|nr:hypothetical protein QQP08_009397 [Theobroma cacao]
MTFQNRSNSHPKTPDVVVVVMVVVMVMMLVLFFIDHALNIAELLHVARDGDGALLIESVLFLGFLQKLHEERVVDIDHWDHKPLLLLPLTYQDCQTPLWNIFQKKFCLISKLTPEGAKSAERRRHVGNEWQTVRHIGKPPGPPGLVNLADRSGHLPQKRSKWASYKSSTQKPKAVDEMRQRK